LRIEVRENAQVTLDQIGNDASHFTLLAPMVALARYVGVLACAGTGDSTTGFVASSLTVVG
jgi:hypothetical protein